MMFFINKKGGKLGDFPLPDVTKNGHLVSHGVFFNVFLNASQKSFADENQ